ncbi:MAG: hypothetical protein O7G85_16555, partial [Planctomycetota bacterium]|nr:hypothetical protein [Planctomycetota bacterium]
MKRWTTILTLKTSLLMLAMHAGCSDQTPASPDQAAIETTDSRQSPATTAESQTPPPAAIAQPTTTLTPPDSFTNQPPPDLEQGDVKTYIGQATRSYRLLLEEIVTDDGLVRYELAARDRIISRIGMAIKRYGVAWLPEDRGDLLAYYCNTYNANVLFQAMMEQTKPGFTSVNDIEGFFKKRPI